MVLTTALAVSTMERRWKMCDGSDEIWQIPASVVNLLDTYFSDSSDSQDGGREYIKNFKTTAEIKEDLSDMLEIAEETIFYYMSERYNTVLVRGVVKWEVYKKVK